MDPRSWLWRVLAIFAVWALVLGLLWIIVKHEIVFGALWLVVFALGVCGISIYWLRRRSPN
jgi:hypothetical protein